jgi:hypothetical protein
MTPQEIERQRAALEAERDRLTKRIKQAQKRIDDDKKAGRKVVQKLHRLSVIEALHVVDGVRLAYRGWAKDKRLDDALGTVIEVKRTRCVVDFGSLGKWRFPIEDVLPVASGEEQGFRSWLPLPMGVDR